MKKQRRSKSQRRAQVARGNPPKSNVRTTARKLPLLIVLLVAAAGVALYGMRYIRGPRDPNQQQGAGVATATDPSPKAAPAANADRRSESDVPSAGTPGESRKAVPAAESLSWSEIDDPSKDGWDTEVFTGKAMTQLKTLGKLLTHPDDIDAAALNQLITEDFACAPLRPGNLVTVLDDQHLKIERPAAADAGRSPAARPEGDAELPFRGGRGLAESLRALLAPLASATEVRFKFKVFRVAAATDEVSTRQYFAISGRTSSGAVEQHATWDVSWVPSDDDSNALPRMRWIRVVEFEQAESRQPGGTLFTDCTKSVLAGNRSYAEQFLRGMNHWFQRIQDPSFFKLFGNPGLAIGDVNGDGLDDLYVCQEAGLPNRLFIQQTDGTALDQSASWGVDWLDSSRSALLVDLDNDSDQDLVVAIMGGVVVAENDGEGQFHLRDVLSSSVDTMSVSAVDYDLDGQLDIYVCGYYANEDLEHGDTVSLPGAAAGFVVHDANNGGQNNLFRNEISADGSWRFRDVTAEVGLNENNHRFSFAAAWDDYDNDGDQDLYVANDYGRDHFYRNDLRGPSAAGAEQRATRQFVDISDFARVEDSASGMSVTWGDYDRDGWMDVLVSNMWSSAGNRIAFQEKFRPETPPEIKRRYQRLARGNTLLRNLGDGTFTDRSAPAGVEMGRWAWGSHFVDLNNDGWEDLFVSNGYITTEDTGDL